MKITTNRSVKCMITVMYEDFSTGSPEIIISSSSCILREEPLDNLVINIQHQIPSATGILSETYIAL